MLTVVRVMIAKYRKSGIWGYHSSLTPEPVELKECMSDYITHRTPLHHGVTRGLGGKRFKGVKCNPHGVEIPYFFVIALPSVQTRVFGASP